MRHLASTPTVWRYSCTPVPAPSLPPTPELPPEFAEAIGANGPPALIDTPPRPWRVLPLVSPLRNTVEIIGLMSSPFITVISGLTMNAKLSPRDCGVHPASVVVAVWHLLLKVAVPVTFVELADGAKPPLPRKFLSVQSLGT